jgi:hypothetical protein
MGKDRKERKEKKGKKDRKDKSKSRKRERYSSPSEDSSDEEDRRRREASKMVSLEKHSLAPLLFVYVSIISIMNLLHIYKLRFLNNSLNILCRPKKSSGI